MVAALLRALGFEDDTESAPGEGQDRAPVGAGQDRVGVGAAGPPSGDPAFVQGISQNDVPLSRSDAMAFCGPTAALFMTRAGRPPTGAEAQQLREIAVRHGWTPGRGAAGPTSIVAMARDLGVQVEQGPADPARIRADATAGLPVVISTPQGSTAGHYWQISDYDAASGKFLMGDAVGRNRLMSLDEIQRDPSYGGGPLTAIYTAGEARQTDRAPSARATGQPQLLSAQAPGQQAQGGGLELIPNAPATSPPGGGVVPIPNAPGGPSPGAMQPLATPGQPPSVQRIAMNALNATPSPANPEIADIMAAGALKESGANPNGPPGDGGASIGLWQLHARGLGQGMTEAQRRDPVTAAARIAPAYQGAYREGQQRGFEGEDLATYTYINAEHPADAPGTTRPATMTGPTAQQFRAHYAEVEAHSKQREELQIGGGYVPVGGAAGQQNAGGQPNLVQQAFDQAAPVIQDLIARAQGTVSAAGERVASLGATPAYAAPAPAAGPPGGPTPQVQQPPPPTHPGPTDVDEHGQPVGPNVPLPAMPGWVVAGRQAAGPAQVPPIQAPSALPPPATQPAASVAQTQAPPAAAPAQEPLPGGLGTNAPEAGAPTYGPARPPSSGPPPDTDTMHWDNSILAWVPKNPPADFGSAGGRYRLPAGVIPATDANGNPTPNPPGTPVEYVPNQPGPYAQGYFDGANWHAPTAASQQTQGAQTHDLGGGLRFLQPDPKSPNGTWLWTDPVSHVTRSAPGSLADPTPPAGLQTASDQQMAPTTVSLPDANGNPQQYIVSGSPSSPTLAPLGAPQGQRITPTSVTIPDAQGNPQQFLVSGDPANPTMAPLGGPQPQRIPPTSTTINGQSYIVSGDPANPTMAPLGDRQTQVTSATHGRDVAFFDPNNPQQGPVSTYQFPETATEHAQAQTAQLANQLPVVVANQVYRPVTNPDTGEVSYGDPQPVPLSSYEQANIDQQTAVEAEKQREFGTLSAEQQAVQQQNQASLAQNESQFQQNLQEKQAESARPYSQMTKAEQAQNAIQQQELGLKQQQLGFQETESANKLQNLPRGGIARVNPYTGQIEMVNAPEPEDIRMVGSQIYIPGGRQVSMLGQQISGGPNPYAGVPSGQGAPFSYPGGSGGGGQSFGAGGWGGGGMSGGMGGSPAWQPPQQQRQGWMGSGY